MRNIFLFIRRYFNFLFFLVLQTLALSLLFRYNRYHEAAFLNVAGEITGRIGAQFSGISYYFQLRQANAELVAQNEKLLNSLPENFVQPDTSQTLIRDSVRLDTLMAGRRFLWRAARVVNNSLVLQHNYITLHRGHAQGVRKDMGVVSAAGVVGTVVHTSANFSVVMSLLHRQTSISARLARTGDLGRVIWNGESPFRLTMENIPYTAQVQPGDSVVTSGYSLAFPPGILVGTVEEVEQDTPGGFYRLQLRPATDFHKLEHVMVVENLQQREQAMLEEAVREQP